MRDTEKGRDTGRGGKQAPCREPDAGLDPGTPGSCPGSKAGAEPLSHQGSLLQFFWSVFRLCSIVIPLRIAMARRCVREILKETEEERTLTITPILNRAAASLSVFLLGFLDKQFYLLSTFMDLKQRFKRDQWISLSFFFF